MFKFLLPVSLIAAVASSASPGFAQSKIKLTPGDEYARIPTRSEALAKEPKTPTLLISGRRPKVERTPLTKNLGNFDTSSGSNGGLVLGSIPTTPSRPDRSASDEESIETSRVVEISKVLGEGSYGHYDEPKELDLLKFLPAPRKQQQQNCVAWAIGYANYSCQICQQRLVESPTAPHDLFSPSFIYNTLSPDKDEGLYVGEAVDFIKKYGCATLGTMPIGDSHPSQSARKEAALYRALDHQKAAGIDDIRAYLQDGYPVILVVRLDEELDTGEFEGVYSWDESKMTKQIRPHAVCAVGYNDEEKTVLVMNSEGKDWHKTGFFEVSYDTLTTIPTNRGGLRSNGAPVRDDELPFWCVEAHVVMVKERTPSVSLEFDDFEVNFRVQGKMVVNGTSVVTFDVSKNAEWKIRDVTTNQETIFLLREDQLVVELNNKKEYVFDDDAYPKWLHLTNGIPANSRVSMIAANTGTPLFAITNKGALLKREIKKNAWEVEKPAADQDLNFVDLRDHDQSYVTATAANGRIFRFESQTGWQDLSMVRD